MYPRVKYRKLIIADNAFQESITPKNVGIGVCILIFIGILVAGILLIVAHDNLEGIKEPLVTLDYDCFNSTTYTGPSSLLTDLDLVCTRGAETARELYKDFQLQNRMRSAYLDLRNSVAITFPTEKVIINIYRPFNETH